MKPSHDPIKVKFVTQIKPTTLTNIFGNKHVEQIPTGEIHIFEIINAEINAFSFCGLKCSQIGEEVKAWDKRPESLAICKKCEETWKTDTRSPWKAWITATTLKEKE